MKVMVVVLVAIAVAAVLVLFYGSVRPPGDPASAEAGVDGSLGWLSPSQTLDVDDLRSAARDDCADFAADALVVDAGESCAFDVAEPAEVVLCAAPASDLVVVVDGRDYPAQEFAASDLPCDPGDDPIPIYDVETVLTIACPGPAACEVAVVAGG